jgi:branched-chain amino acid transport system ATP-binding protein
MLLLDIDHVHTFYGRAQALKGICLQIQEGELVAILGANGSGKTTLLNSISGILKPRSGHIEFEGRRIEGMSTDAIVKLGITQCPEGRRLFPDMAVLKNLQMGAYVRRKDILAVQKDLEAVFNLFPILDKRRNQSAGTMSGGEQQMLAIGRALMAHPKLLLLDEPSLGLAPLIVARIFEAIENINRNGTAVCLVEQNASMAIHISNRGYVLENGEIVLSGTREHLQKDEKVRQAYLGV